MERIFGNLIELHELSVKLLGDLDDCIEMSGEMVGDSSVPQAGIIFEDLAEVRWGRGTGVWGDLRELHWCEFQ